MEDTDALREILLFAREVPNAYAGAPPGLKKQYLRFFFKEFVVKERRIAKVVLTDFFQALLRGSFVRTERNWLPSLDAIRTLISALANRPWLQKQLQFVRNTRSSV